ncbi:hypothetical protein BQ8482_220053 [Mesorhizobium delmotii]|uniref:Uncharacterized protein n=1 Tax=Mesorhizobium delmotii TaxID=1631247 RepID=A0A2P9ALA4_9HYPH|nr:hypothetical protein BQ8482_220053 [Mesorhizobium delmotii]
MMPSTAPRFDGPRKPDGHGQDSSITTDAGALGDPSTSNLAVQAKRRGTVALVAYTQVLRGMFRSGRSQWAYSMAHPVCISS